MKHPIFNIILSVTLNFFYSTSPVSAMLKMKEKDDKNLPLKASLSTKPSSSEKLQETQLAVNPQKSEQIESNGVSSTSTAEIVPLGDTTSITPPLPEKVDMISNQRIKEIIELYSMSSDDNEASKANSKEAIHKLAIMLTDENLPLESHKKVISFLFEHLHTNLIKAALLDVKHQGDHIDSNVRTKAYTCSVLHLLHLTAHQANCDKSGVEAFGFVLSSIKTDEELILAQKLLTTIPFSDKYNEYLFHRMIFEGILSDKEKEIKNK